MPPRVDFGPWTPLIQHSQSVSTPTSIIIPSLRTLPDGADACISPFPTGHSGAAPLFIAILRDERGVQLFHHTHQRTLTRRVLWPLRSISHHRPYTATIPYHTPHPLRWRPTRRPPAARRARPRRSTSASSATAPSVGVSIAAVTSDLVSAFPSVAMELSLFRAG